MKEVYMHIYIKKTIITWMYFLSDIHDLIFIEHYILNGCLLDRIG
jgi:hypothetical protein